VPVRTSPLELMIADRTYVHDHIEEMQFQIVEIDISAKLVSQILQAGVLPQSYRAFAGLQFGG
jgi:hypothetical protein